MNPNRFIKVLTLYFIISFSFSIFAQGLTIKNRVSVKLGGSSVNSGIISDRRLNPLILIGVDYKINRFIDLGVYGGYATIMHNYELPYNETTGMYEWYSADSTSFMISNDAGFSSSSKAYCYGINTIIHLLPFIFPENMRIHMYLSPKVGIISERYYNHHEVQGPDRSNSFVEYSLGVGLKYSFTKLLGIYAEYSLGKFYNNNNNNMNSRKLAGISIKF